MERPTKPKIKQKIIPVRMSDKLHDDTKKCAEIEQESVSEYIRKAIERMNKILLQK